MLIKQANAKELARDAIVLDLGDLARQGEQLRLRAQAEADRLLAEARAERDRLIGGAREEGLRQGLEEGRRRGHEEGFQEGRAAALVEMRARLEALAASWGRALDRLEAEREAVMAEARRDVLRLAIAVAEKVTKRVVRVDEGVAAAQLAAVLELITKPTRLAVFVHPGDLEPVRDALPALCERLASGSPIELAVDEGLERGSCIARTIGGGVIDASIDTQLQRIAEALLPERGSREPDPPGPSRERAP